MQRVADLVCTQTLLETMEHELSQAKVILDTCTVDVLSTTSSSLPPLLPTPPSSHKLVPQINSWQQNQNIKPACYFFSPLTPSSLPPLLPTPLPSQKLSQGTLVPVRWSPPKIMEIASISTAPIPSVPHIRSRKVWIQKKDILNYKEQNSLTETEPIHWSSLGVDTFPSHPLTCLGVPQERHPNPV